MKQSEFWLSDNVDPLILSNISMKIQSFSQHLRMLEGSRIKDLQDNGPKITHSGTEWILVLLREGKEKYICFGDSTIELSYCEKQEERDYWKLTEPSEADGVTYFIVASPTHYDNTPFAVYLTKDEFDILKIKMS